MNDKYKVSKSCTPELLRENNFWLMEDLYIKRVPILWYKNAGTKRPVVFLQIGVDLENFTYSTSLIFPDGSPEPALNCEYGCKDTYVKKLTKQTDSTLRHLCSVGILAERRKKRCLNLGRS